MNKFVISSLLAILPLAAAAADAGRFLGQWSSTRGGQSITWEFRSDGIAVFGKDGIPAGEAPWLLRGDGAVVKASPGEFVVTPKGSDSLTITPPRVFNEPAAVFKRTGS